MPDPVTAIAGTIAGAAANIFGAQSAAQAQQQAAQQANATILQQQQGLTAQKNFFDSTAPLAGIAGQGATAYSNLNAAIPGLTAPITMDQKTLEATPGYNWNLTQGERGVGRGAAATGLSGGQAKAAATYATGLADSTYQSQFANANTNKTNAFNFLLNTANRRADMRAQLPSYYRSRDYI
jgi:type II secretory pathway pseudopilin PulG